MLMLDAIGGEIHDEINSTAQKCMCDNRPPRRVSFCSLNNKLTLQMHVFNKIYDLNKRPSQPRTATTAKKIKSKNASKQLCTKRGPSFILIRAELQGTCE